MNDKIYEKMLLRRRFFKRVSLMVIAFTISFYISIILFGDLKVPRVMTMTDLNRCPACFGVSVCPELYSNQVIIESNTWSSMFNTKNIFYGYTKSNRRVVMKKLAHNSEWKAFDQQLCKNFHLKQNCKPMHLLNVSNIDDKLIKLVEYNLSKPDTRPRKGLVMCPYAYSLFDFILPVLNSKKDQVDIVNIWTMLSINPEPIIFQVLQRSHGWPIPAYGGVCGRVEVVAYEGEPLASLTHVPWHRKLKFAKKILDAAMDFTFKHDRYRFYLMDWSLDNIVANEKDDITFIDLEDIVVLDKHISPRSDLPDWYQRYARDIPGPGFTFSIHSMCKHHLSDHNLWAACYILIGDEDPFLYPLPKDVNASRPHLDRLLKECLNGEDRFRTITKLQHVIDDMLMDENIIGLRAGVR
nr:divergent protein kinase domain 2A [Helicoverpa armigera]